MNTDRTKAIRIYRNCIENAILRVPGAFKVTSIRTKSHNSRSRDALKNLVEGTGSIVERIKQFDETVGHNSILITRVEVECQGMNHLVLDIVAHIEMDEVDHSIVKDTHPEQEHSNAGLTAVLEVFSFMHFTVTKVDGIDTRNITDRIADELSHCMA